MHPIHYSAFINGLILVVSGAISYLCNQPMLFVVGMLLIGQNHMVGRFDNMPGNGEEPPNGDYDATGRAGFVKGEDE